MIAPISSMLERDTVVMPQRPSSVCRRAASDSSLSRRNGTFRRSIRVPISDSRPGSRNVAYSTAVSTPSAPPMPSFVMNGMPITARPVIEIATVTPAKITARPAVAAA